MYDTGVIWMPIENRIAYKASDDCTAIVRYICKPNHLNQNSNESYWLRIQNLLNQFINSNKCSLCVCVYYTRTPSVWHIDAAYVLRWEKRFGFSTPSFFYSLMANAFHLNNNDWKFLRKYTLKQICLCHRTMIFFKKGKCAFCDYELHHPHAKEYWNHFWTRYFHALSFFSWFRVQSLTTAYINRKANVSTSA